MHAFTLTRTQFRRLVVSSALLWLAGFAAGILYVELTLRAAS